MVYMDYILIAFQLPLLFFLEALVPHVSFFLGVG
jgi:hypothetical protein